MWLTWGYKVRGKGSYLPHIIPSVKIKPSNSSTNSVSEPSRKRNSKIHFFVFFYIYFLRRQRQLIITSLLKDLC